MGPIVSVLFALTATLLLWFVAQLFVMRRRMKGLPGPPHHPIFGHLLVGWECDRQFPKDAHPHVYADFIRRKYKLGKAFYVDFWPVGPQFLYITDPDLANQVALRSNLPKHPLVTKYVDRLLGPQNLVTLEGAPWKVLRTIFNPGFASAQLMTLVPFIVDSTVVYRDVLKEKVGCGEVFEMEEISTRLTLDIIAKVSLDLELNSQRSEHRIVTTFRKQVAYLPVSSVSNPLRGLSAKLTAPLLTWYNGRKLDRYIGEELDQRYSNRTLDEKSTAAGGDKKKTRYAVDLALDTYQKDFHRPNNKQESQGGHVANIDPNFRYAVITQIKTFVFAGHDTTSSTVTWVFYFLHEYPHVLAKVVDELDRVLGPKSEEWSHACADKIRTDPYLINRLPYITAVIKETLRIFPPASTMREGHPSLTLTDPDIPGSSYPTNGFAVWNVSHAIHRNELYFPDPTSFVPERHLDGLPNPPFPHAKPHKDAWRPFEKGPRSCIGQELAMVEAKIIVALTAREFDFELVYPSLQGSGQQAEKQIIEGRRCYQMLKGSAKPNAGAPGRIRMR